MSSRCPDCRTLVAEPDEGLETTYTCPECGTRWMDNPRWKERFGL